LYPAAPSVKIIRNALMVSGRCPVRAVVFYKPALYNKDTPMTEILPPNMPEDDMINEALKYINELKVMFQEVYLESLSLSDYSEIEVKKYMARMERCVRQMKGLDLSIDKNLLEAMTPSQRQIIRDAANEIFSHNSVITNNIRQLMAVITEAPAPPEIEPPSSEVA
jgi:hypothetical protein